MPLPRAVRVVLSLILAGVLVSMAGVLLLVFLASRGPSVAASSTLVVRPRGALPEREADDLLGQVLRDDESTVRGVVDSLRKAKRDTRITAVLLLPGAIDSPYWGKLQEIRAALLDFRTSGKTVIAHLEQAGDREYYLASAADRVYLLPTSPLDLTGVASSQVFLRGALDKIGAYPDFLHVGRYKSAPEQLTETGMSPANREMSESLNRDAYDQLVRAIAESRRKSEDEVRGLIDGGPFLAEDALRAGLVDGLAYEDQLDDQVAELRAGGDPAPRIDLSDYQHVSAPSLGLRGGRRIAVIHAIGTIVSGRSAIDPINGSLLGAESLVDDIRKVRADASIDGIVLRIDSPGGSSVASDVIWRELTITRDQKPSRPLVASMSDLAASGGYYIAMPAQAIVAQPGTLTGSIGIFGGKVVTGGTMGKLGITGETIKDGANADIYSTLTPFSPDQRAKVQGIMDAFYRAFTQKAAEARKMTPERLDAVAQGRVWTGAQAQANGLVDRLGGLDAAIAEVKERLEIPADEDVEIVPYPAERTLYEAVSDLLRGNSAARLSLWSLFGGPDARAFSAASSPARLFRRGEPLALMPLVFAR